MAEVKKARAKKKRKKQSHNMQVSASKWTPSSKQIELVKLLLNPDDRRSKKDKILSLKLAESTYYRWIADNRFTDYLNSRIDKYTEAELPEMWKALINQGKRGNMQAIKLFFELKDRYTPVANKQKFDQEKLELEREKFEHIKEMDKMGMF